MRRAEKTSRVSYQGKFDPDYPTVSQSWLKLHEQCAFAAFLRYIEGLEDPPTGHTTIGTAVDAAITYGANSVISNGKDASLSDKLEIAARTFDDRAPETRFFKDLIRPNCRAMTLDLVRLHHSEVAPKLRPVQAGVSIRADFESYRIAGKIDLIEEGDLLSDHKTANSPKRHEVPVSAQSAMYSWLFQIKHGRKPTGFRFWSLLKLKRPKVESTKVGRVTAASHELLQYRIASAISEMRNSLKTGLWRLAKEGDWKCDENGKYCPYLYKGCPKGKARRR